MPIFHPLRPLLAGMLCAALLLAPGCASIFTPGAERPVRVESDPTGADVLVNGELRGVTPLIVKVDRRDVHDVVVALEGYEPFEREVRPGLNGWLFGNLVFGGLIGLAIDFINGADKAPSPGRIRATLRPAGDGRGYDRPTRPLPVEPGPRDVDADAGRGR